MCIVEAFLADENRVGVFRGEIAPGLRGASLENHGLALPGTGNVERAFYREKFPFVLKGMQLAGGKELAALLVIGEGIVFPGIPQALDHIHMLFGDAVAHGVGRVFGLAEVVGGAAEPGRHYVPAGATTADVIQ
ncbi:hypothetical protein D3C85_1045760 [compost metagenome]